MSVADLTEQKVSRNAAPPVEDVEGDAPAQAPDPKKTLSDALAAVSAYVPTEIIAAYTLALAVAVGDRVALDDAGHPIAPGLPLIWFVVFLISTPMFVWLVFAVRSKERRQPFTSPRVWPWWEATSASIAFIAWSAALPRSAFTQFTWYSSSAAAVVLVLVSGLLPYLGALVTKTT